MVQADPFLTDPFLTRGDKKEMFLGRVSSAVLVVLLGGAWFSVYGSELCVNVSDETDLPLANAWVNVTRMVPSSDGQVEALHASTDSKGHVCVMLSEGTYSVEAGLTGFLNVRYQPVRIVYPNRRELAYRLPIGDSTEGGVDTDAVLSGILESAGKPVQSAKICVTNLHGTAVIACGGTNDLGEYGISVPRGTYRVEIQTWGKKVYRSTVNVAHPGYHRNLLSIDEEGH
jgi:hypothetical protein